MCFYKVFRPGYAKTIGVYSLPDVVISECHTVVVGDAPSQGGRVGGGEEGGTDDVCAYSRRFKVSRRHRTGHQPRFGGHGGGRGDMAETPIYN